MIQKIINEIKIEYRKHKIQTGFMGTILLLALLTYLKPGSTDSLLGYIGITAINFIILSAIIVGIWFYLRRKKWNYLKNQDG